MSTFKWIDPKIPTRNDDVSTSDIFEPTQRLPTGMTAAATLPYPFTVFADIISGKGDSQLGRETGLSLLSGSP